MATDSLSSEDKDFLAKCEEELKDRYTEKDEEFMKVFNADSPKPPILESWWVPQHSGRRNDRRNNRWHNPYERYGNRGREHHGRRDYRDNRDYNSHNSGYHSRGQGYRQQRNRYD